MIVQHLDSLSRIWKRRLKRIEKRSEQSDSECVDWNASHIIPLIQVQRKMRAHYEVS